MDRTCGNCKTELVGDFCHNCGQENRTYLKNVFSIMGEFFQEFGSWDSRFARTIVPLLFNPGFLSDEFVAGRRARYVPPMRLYIFISIVFFLLLALVARVEPGMMGEGVISDAAVTAPAVPSRASDGMNVNIPFLGDEMNAAFKRRIDRVADNPDLLVRQLRNLAPTMMFLLLPLFAFILKVFYIYKRRWYTEHLVLALHTHSFLFLSFMLLIGLSKLEGPARELTLAPMAGSLVSWLMAALITWIPVYLFLAQRRFYRQGWILTTFKYLLTGTTYVTMMSVFGLMLVVASVMTA